MFALFDICETECDREYYHLKWVEGKDKDDCKKKIEEHMDYHWAGCGESDESDGVYKTYDLGDERTIGVSSIEFFPTDKELKTAFMQKASI